MSYDKSFALSNIVLLTDRETAKLGPFQPSNQAATCYYLSNHSKVETIPLSALPIDPISELVNIHTVSLMLKDKQRNFVSLLVWINKGIKLISTDYYPIFMSHVPRDGCAACIELFCPNNLRASILALCG